MESEVMQADMEIIEIPPKKREYATLSNLRVAAYCRVSTNTEEQQSSLNFQKWFYNSMIDENPGWENAGVFADVSSGRNIRGRMGFQEMMKACRKGKISIILTKSVSRFGRNTLDGLQALQKFRELDVDVWFETEGIHLLSEKSRILIETLSAFAQVESESKSENIKWGLKHSFLTGNSKMSNFICYGYVQDTQGELVIQEKEAEVVQAIFRLYLEGYSLNGIARELENKNIPSPAGKPKWSSQTLDRLLSNEKYIGNIMLQKTYIKDFFSGKQVKNTGQLDRYYIRNHHTPSISQKDFESVQLEKKRRTNVSYTKRGNPKRNETRYSSHSLSGLLICGECGRS